MNGVNIEMTQGTHELKVWYIETLSFMILGDPEGFKRIKIKILDQLKNCWKKKKIMFMKEWMKYK